MLKNNTVSKNSQLISFPWNLHITTLSNNKHP
jgi:hypothetical protein